MNILLVTTEAPGEYPRYIQEIGQFAGVGTEAMIYEFLPSQVLADCIIAVDLPDERIEALMLYQKPIISARMQKKPDEKFPSLLIGRFSYQTFKKVLASIFLKSADDSALARIVGQSQKVRELRAFIQQVAPSQASVLISGESGTGKEVVAKAIHQNSERCREPFLAINCAAIPSELLESELFGHEKGAFTGAHQSKAGRFELASQGTLFLDEIGDMPLGMQSKLLRVLQEKTFERLGGEKVIVSNARIIAATNQNLPKLVQEGHFREDLFYRLNVLPLHLPTLRERKEDIPLLLERLLWEITPEGNNLIQFTHKAVDALVEYDWPGNIRQFAHFLQRITVLYPGHLISEEIVSQNLENFSADLLVKKEDYRFYSPLKQYLENVEKGYIEIALKNTGGVVTKAANILGMQRTTLIEKMKKYQLRG